MTKDERILDRSFERWRLVCSVRRLRRESLLGVATSQKRRVRSAGKVAFDCWKSGGAGSWHTRLNIC